MTLLSYRIATCTSFHINVPPPSGTILPSQIFSERTADSKSRDLAALRWLSGKTGLDFDFNLFLHRTNFSVESTFTCFDEDVDKLFRVFVLLIQNHGVQKESQSCRQELTQVPVAYGGRRSQESRYETAATSIPQGNPS